MALQTEIWRQDIEENLFANNEFATMSLDQSAFASNKVVHVPQSGANPTVEVNRSVLPATASQRADTELTYSLNEYTTDPIVVRDLEDIQTSYNKRQSVLQAHMDSMNDRIGDQTAFDWSVSGAPHTLNIVRTSGSLLSDALAPSATGTRKALDKIDVRNLAKRFDKQNVPANDRFLLLNSDMFYQLFSDSQLLSKDFMLGSSQEKGVITELYGFKIMKRSKVVIYDNAVDPVKKAVGAVGAIDDNLGCIAWQRSAVARAMQGIKTFGDTDVPEWYGSVFSAMAIYGSTILRSDIAGVGAIVQSA
jgi:hypothetical protein